MKLDRNINPDGKGKYGLIKIRECEEECFEKLKAIEGTPHTYAEVNGDSVDLGSSCPFFVIKYKDKFAAAAVKAYASAAGEEAARLEVLAMTAKPGLAEFYKEEAEDLLEFAMQVREEAVIATNWPTKQFPTH